MPLHEILFVLFGIAINVAWFGFILWAQLNPLYVLEDGDL